MNKKLILSGFIALLSLHVNAQLARRAFLGTQLVQVNDSVARVHNMEQPRGVLVLKVVEQSSAGAMGIEAGDVVLSINNTNVNSPSEMVGLVGSQRTGDRVFVTLLRNGRKKELTGTLRPLPHETSAFGEVIYDAVPFDGGFVRTIIHKPEKEGKVPVVFFIQGYTCSSIDRMGEDNAYKKLIDGLVEKGYAVVKTEKAGMGDSRNDRPCEQYSLFEEVELFSASYNSLASYDFIDTTNIFIFGHSMGGVQAPLLKTEIAPRGIAVYGTVIRPWFEYFLEHSRVQQFLLGVDYKINEAQHDTALRLFYGLMVEKKTPSELAQDDAIKRYMSDHWGYQGTDILLGRHYTFWQELQDTKLFSAWANTPAHVLSLWGEAEFIAFNPYEHQLIADVVNRYHPGKGQLITLPNMDHGFTWVENREHAIEIRNDAAYIAAHFNPAIVDTLVQWMNRVQQTPW